MAEQSHSYIIIGAGLSGISAADGIRQLDQRNSILVIGAEKDMPYDRPPLSKQLWTGGKSVDDVFLHDEDFYKNGAIDLHLGVEVARIDPATHTVHDCKGNT